MQQMMKLRARIQENSVKFLAAGDGAGSVLEPNSYPKISPHISVMVGDNITADLYIKRNTWVKVDQSDHIDLSKFCYNIDWNKDGRLLFNEINDAWAKRIRNYNFITIDGDNKACSPANVVFFGDTSIYIITFGTNSSSVRVIYHVIHSDGTKESEE